MVYPAHENPRRCSVQLPIRALLHEVTRDSSVTDVPRFCARSDEEDVPGLEPEIPQEILVRTEQATQRRAGAPKSRISVRSEPAL
ncbi:MAG: hypothetical protein ACREXM_18665 [Gammaproteobacteria bacterium]